MANLTTKTFAQLVSDQVTAIQGAARTLIDFTIGSILRSIVESNSAVALWVQGLILQLLATTRAATSAGTDLDSWAADFNFYRLVAVAASGQVVFSRFTATQAAFIPVGTQIQTRSRWWRRRRGRTDLPYSAAWRSTGRRPSS